MECSKRRTIVRVCFIIFFVFTGMAKTAAQNQGIRFIEKPDTIYNLKSDMVLMEKDIFLDYYLSKIALDSITMGIPVLEKNYKDLTLTKNQSLATMQAMIDEQEKVLRKKEKTIRQMQSLVNAGVESNEECIKRLEKSFHFNPT